MCVFCEGIRHILITPNVVKADPFTAQVAEAAFPGIPAQVCTQGNQAGGVQTFAASWMFREGKVAGEGVFILLILRSNAALTAKNIARVLIGEADVKSRIS